MNTLQFSAPTNLPKIFSRGKGRMPAFCRAFISCVGVLLTVSPLGSQTFQTISPLDVGFAGAVTARSNDYRFASGNPASLQRPDNDKGGILAAFTPSALGIPKYREGSFIAATSFGTKFQLGLSGTTLGAGAYHESSAGIIASTNLHAQLSVGAEIALYNLNIHQYGSRTVPVADIGVLAQLANNLAAGASFTNITRSNVAGSTISQRLALGLLYIPDSTFSLSLDFSQELQRESGLAFGISWIPINHLVLRGGLGSSPERVGYGLGYRVGNITLDYGGSYTSPLGFRQTFGTGIYW